MTTVRWKMVDTLGCDHTYGHITKSKRIAMGLEKSHVNDAFCIAGGSSHSHCKPLKITQVSRKNRSLQKFYDAKYIDIRTGKKASGQELNNGRRTRNCNLNGPNLRIYRVQKTSKGRVSIRKRRYPFQLGDSVILNNNKYIVKGTQNLGEYVRLVELPKPVRVTKLRPLYYGKGLRVS